VAAAAVRGTTTPVVVVVRVAIGRLSQAKCLVVVHQRRRQPRLLLVLIQ
jgi:hypothetical protein